MIVYIAARIFAELYGYGWPLHGEVQSLLATASVGEFIVVSLFAAGFLVQWLTGRKGGRR